jgi:hypothetical protein
VPEKKRKEIQHATLEEILKSQCPGTFEIYWPSLERKEKKEKRFSVILWKKFSTINGLVHSKYTGPD